MFLDKFTGRIYLTKKNGDIPLQGFMVILFWVSYVIIVGYYNKLTLD